MSKNTNPSAEVDKDPAAIKEISLSQAILSPLDALFKAQVHAARSFLNLLLQIGYPHVGLNKDGIPEFKDNKDKGVYTQDFYFNDSDGKQMKVSIPTLALVPITPLTIDNASFKLNFKVENTQKHQQIQDSENESIKKEQDSGWNDSYRPWFLVKEPVGFIGRVAPSQNTNSESFDSSSSIINIEINLVRQSLPAGLDKLLTSLQQASKIENI